MQSHLYNTLTKKLFSSNKTKAITVQVVVDNNIRRRHRNQDLILLLPQNNMENKNTLQYSIEAEPIDPLDPLQYDQEVHNIQQQETEVPVAEPLLNIVNGDTAAKDEQEGGTFCKLLKTRRTRFFVLLSAIFLTTTIVTVVALFINNNNDEDNDQPSPNQSMSPIETSPATSNKSSSKWKDDYNPNLKESISAFFSESDTQGSAKGAIYGMLSRGKGKVSMCILSL